MYNTRSSRARFTTILVCVLLTLVAASAIDVGADGPTGSRATTMLFTGSGYNTTLNLTIPKDSFITKASMNITGLEWGGSNESFSMDFTDLSDKQAWYGDHEGFPNWSGPNFDPGAYYRDNQFSATNYTQVNSSDDVRVETDATVPGGMPPTCPYHHFEFTVDDLDLVEINVTWEGIGYHNTGMGNYSGYGNWLFIYNATADGWNLLDSFTNPNPGDRVLKGSIDYAPEDYINATDSTVHIIVLGVMDHYMGNPGDLNYLRSDYIELNTSYAHPASYPTNPTLDVGDDGSIDWQEAGAFSSTKVLGDADGFKTVLQGFVDAAGPGPGDVVVVLNFTSSSGGILGITDTVIDYEADRPVFDTIPDQTMEEDMDAVPLIDLWDLVADNGGDQNLSFAVIYEENNTLLDAEIDADGHNLNFYIQVPDWNGTLKFQVNATDKNGRSVDSNIFNVTVVPVNDRPTIEAVEDQEATAGDVFNLTVNASDIDGPDLTFSDNTTIFDIGPSTGLISFTPTEADEGLHDIRITVTDGEFEANTTFTLTVVVPPPALQLDPIGNQTATEGVLFELTVSALGDGVKTFSDNTTLFNINATTGGISFTPTNDDVGIYKVRITVTMGGLSEYEDVVFTVVNVNDPPVLAPIDNFNIILGDTIEADANGTDIDVGDVLTYSIESGPGGVAINGDTGAITWTPTEVGQFSIVVEVTDGVASAFTTFTVDVQRPNEAPAIHEQTLNKAQVGKKSTYTIQASDPDNDLLTYSLDDPPAGMTIDPQTGVIEWTPTKDQEGEHTFTVGVSDGDLSTTLDFTVTVKPKKESRIESPFSLMVLMALIILIVVILAVVAVAMKMRKKPKEFLPPPIMPEEGVGPGPEDEPRQPEEPMPSEPEPEPQAPPAPEPEPPAAPEPEPQAAPVEPKPEPPSEDDNTLDDIMKKLGS